MVDNKIKGRSDTLKFKWRPYGHEDEKNCKKCDKERGQKKLYLIRFESLMKRKQELLEKQIPNI